MKKLIISIVMICGLLSVTGCQKWLDVNKNVDAPDQIEDYLYLSGIQSAYQGCYWDIRALGPLTYMMGTDSYTNFAAHYYSASSDAAGELWRMTYWLQGVNLENMISQAIEKERWTLAGMGYAMKAYSWDCLTKYHADAPCLQAYEPGRLSFDYDSQEIIMEKVREWANEAIKYLEMDDKTDYASQLKTYDLIFSGNRSQWLSFAHSIIVSDLAALTKKADFASKYAPEMFEHAAKAIQSNADNVTLRREGKGEGSLYSAYNNFWGTWRENLFGSTASYWQSEYIVQIMTGTVPQYDHETGDRVKNQIEVDGKMEFVNEKFPWKLNEHQIISDTTKAAGHYDPRIAAKLAIEEGMTFENMNDADKVKSYYVIGGTRTGYADLRGSGDVPGLYGTSATSTPVGPGRWIFRDDAPYILMTAAELQFDLAEAYFVTGEKGKALEAFKRGVALDEEFTAQYINPGKAVEEGTDDEGNKTYKVGGENGGCPISIELFNTLAGEYLAGPYVELSVNDLTLSHIMMQKYVALWPWGALQAWTDLRKYNYDIPYSNEYPENGNGWDNTTCNHKWDEDATKVFKGFYLAPMQVEGCRGSYNQKNHGSPCYRVRPRYNSEYMWNRTGLDALKPIGGQEENYQCSKPWFVYPGDYPQTTK